MHENTCMDCMVLGHEMVSVGKEDKSLSTTQLPVVSLYRVMVTMLSWDDPESLIVGFECCWPCTSSRVMELVMALAEELWQQNSSMFSKKKDRWKNSKKQWQDDRIIHFEHFIAQTSTMTIIHDDQIQDNLVLLGVAYVSWMTILTRVFL